MRDKFSEVEIGKIKGVIFDIKRMAIHDGPGIRTTVFLKGCNMSCKWCHNPESINKRPELMFNPSKCIECRICEEMCKRGVHEFDHGQHILHREKCIVCGDCTSACSSKALQICGEETTVEKVIDIIMRDKIFYDDSRGGITISGGEPLCQVNFTSALLQAVKSSGINTILDTNGNWDWKEIEDLLPCIDSFRYDLKHMDSFRHKEFTGVSNDRILENLIRLSENNQKVVIVLPLISGINDSDKNITSTIKFIKELPTPPPINILPYHDFYLSKSKQLDKKYRKFRNSSQARIEKIKNRFQVEGIKVTSPSETI